MTTKATPRPWKCNQTEKAFIIYSEQNPAGWVARLAYGADYNEQNANAALIVQAVNSYDAMREALAAAHSWLEAAKVRQAPQAEIHAADKIIQQALTLSQEERS